MVASEGFINVHDHGTVVDKKKVRVQCKYCGKVVSGFFRLKCHLGGIRGDVTPCENAPQNVKELFRNKLLERKIESLSKEVDELNNPNLPCKRNCRPNLNSVKHNKHETTQTAGSCDGRHVDMDSAQEDSLTDSAPLPYGNTDQRSQDLISRQLEDYRHARGSFEEGSAINQRTSDPPVDEAPEIESRNVQSSRINLGFTEGAINGDGPSRFHAKKEPL
ncbi:hypothetical protein CFP56_013477 [Quercus suber]